MDVPLISVIVPVHNDERHLAQALESILAQSFHDFEIIVVDDASTDGTASLLDGFRDRLTLVLHNDTALGPGPARNRGLARARGRWIAFLDSDDRWLPRKLECQVEFARTHPGFGVITTDVRWFNGEQVLQPSLKQVYPIRSGMVAKYLLRDNWVTTSAALVPRALMAEHGDFEPIVSEDWMLWMRIADRHPVYFIDDVLAERRVHAASLAHTRPDHVAELLANIERFRDLVRLPPGAIENAAARVCRINAWSALQELNPPLARSRVRRGLGYQWCSPRLWVTGVVALLPAAVLRAGRSSLRGLRRAVPGAGRPG
ncbi:MAG TPA: glycosyltransferase [Terriglobales bacterium]|jgi:glycosyltransferase involved in cell wall biosynthesis